MDSGGQSGRVGRRAIAIAISAAALLPAMLLGLPMAADAASVTDVGEGFPFAINASDHILLGKFEPAEDGEEENLKGPWSIWASNKSTPILPLNGPVEHEDEPGNPRVELFLDGINASGQVSGTSTVDLQQGDEEVSDDRPVWYSPSGEGHQVPIFQETIKNKEGEPMDVGGLGYGIDDKGDVVGIGVVEADEEASLRGFFAAGGGTPVAVGESDRPSGGASDIFAVNGAGEMVGSTSEIMGHEEPTNTKYYLWKSPSAAGIPLNFDEPTRAIASDGSVAGYRGGQLYLRTPDGKETAVTGLTQANLTLGINSSHQVVGAETVKGAEHAAVWRAGTVTDLNALLPAGSGWVLQRASAINDSGEIAGVGSYEGTTRAFLLKPGLVVTSAKDGKESSGSAAGACDAEGGGCTLRAAIETVDSDKDSAPASVTFNIDKSEITAEHLATITPKTPLPPITAPISIDASTQPGALTAGARTIGAIVVGTEAGDDANGLRLSEGAGESTIAGLQIQNFKGDGVLLEGQHQQLADSVLTEDYSGAEVASDNDLVGAGNGLAGDIFFLDGRLGVVEYLKGLAGKHDSSEEFELGMDAFGGGVVMSKPSSGTQIMGDYIGVHGPGFSSAPDKLAEDGLGSFNFAASGFPIGVVISPHSGSTISAVSIGGAGAQADVISGTAFGVLAATGETGPINGLSIMGNSIGPATDGSALAPLGDLFGVFAAGHVSGLQVGSTTEGNSFGGDVFGLLLGGQQVASPVVQGNTFGDPRPVGNTEKEGFGLHDGFGLMLSDIQGAQIGGTVSGQGNRFPGSLLAVGLDGKHLANDTLAGNIIGTAPSSPFTTFENAPSSYDTVIGVFMSLFAPPGTQSAAQNLTLQNNTIQGTVIADIQENIKGLTMTGNTIENDAFGLFDSGSGGERIGGAGAGEGNSFLNDGIGLLDASTDPGEDELKQAKVNSADSSPSTRQEFLSAPDENLAFDGVDAVTTAELSANSADTTAAPGTGNTIIGNKFGVDGAGNPHPDELPVLIGGDEHSLQFGGTAAGQGNLVEDNRDAGVWIVGTPPHVPTVQVLGNTIYNNENFTGSLMGIPGLGIDLISSNGVGEFGPFGVDPQDPTQPDAGADNLQNSPVLTSATTSGGQLTITGTLHGVASTNYLIEVFVDENQNPFGAGEGQTLLERINLTTEPSGNIGFTSTVAAPAAGYRFVSSTATTIPSSGLGVTSEFSVNAPIVAGAASSGPAGETAPGGSATPGTGASSTTPGAKGAPTTSVGSHGGSASTSGASVTLPAEVSCSSATASPCTVTTTATVSATSATKASVNATAASAKKHGKRPVTIGRATMTLAPGSSAPLQLKLSSSGLALLRSRGSLAIIVTVAISAHGQPTIAHTLRFQLKYKKAKGKTK
jgi:hypothetical protein